MVHIVRGTTGQADLTDRIYNPDCSALPWFGGVWVVNTPEGPIYEEDLEHYGWSGTQSGLVLVPESAPVGLYTFIYQIENGCEYTHPEGGTEPGFLAYFYEFQVVPDVYRPPGPGDPICRL